MLILILNSLKCARYLKNCYDAILAFYTALFIMFYIYLKQEVCCVNKTSLCVRITNLPRSFYYKNPFIWIRAPSSVYIIVIIHL